MAFWPLEPIVAAKVADKSRVTFAEADEALC